MSYNDFLAGYQAWKEQEDRKTRSQSDKRAELPTAGSSAAKGETKKTGLPIAGNKNPYATYNRPSVSSPGLGTMLAPATVPQKTVDTLTPKTQQAQNDAQYNNWLLDLFGRYGTEAGESLAKGADAASRLVQKDASLGERAEAGFDLVKTGLEAGLKGATGGVTNLLDALAGREDTKEAAAAQLAADTTVDDYLGQKLNDVQRQAAIDLLNRYKAENPDIWKADPTTLTEAQEAELAKYRQLDKQLGWMAQTADRLDKGARAVWNNLAATPDVLLETGKAAALNLADNVRNPDWLEALGDAWAGAGYDDVQAMTDEEVRQDAARRAEVAQQLQKTGADRTMDLDTEGAQRMQRAAELQQQAKQGLSGGAALGYDVGMAVADNLITLPMAAIPGVGGGLVLGVQGAKAAAQEANDLAQRGISADEALLRGAVSGGIEAVTEKIGLDNIMDIVGKGGKAALNSLFKDGLQQLAKKGGSGAVGRAVAGVLSNMSAEALEETASYVANYAAAEAFGDPEAEFSIEELAYSALIGGLSGGVLGGGASMVNAITGRGNTAGAQVDQQHSIPGAAPAEDGVPTTTPQGVNGTGVDLTQLYPGAAQGAAGVPTTAPQSVAGTGVDLTQLYPGAQQPAAEQRNQGEAGSGFDIRQLYPDREQPSTPASPSVLTNDQVDALLPSEQRASLEQFAESKGLRVQYINDPDSLVSGSIQGNTMTINLGNGSYALGTAIHEVGHAMKAGDGKAFAEFQDAVLRLADTDPGLRRVAAGIVDAYLGDTSPARASMLNEDGSINRAALNEEVALKLAEELVQDPEQLIRTVSQDRTLIARFLDFVRKIKNSVSIRFTGSQKAMLDEAERTLENMLRGQAGEVSGQRLSIEQDVNGAPFVNITEDILEGVPEREKINTVKKVLRERFPDGFTWNGWKIGLTMPGINEFTRSRYTQRLRNQSNRQMYNDKLRTAANLNEIVEIADNIRNETPNHPRNDNLRSFNRADVRIKVGENEYTAKVVTAILPSTKEIFYDIISLTPTKIRTSLKANQNTAYVVPSSAEMPSTSSIAAPGGIVNTQEEVSRNSDQTARSAAATSGDLKGIDQDNGTERQIASIPSERDLYPTDSVAQDRDIVNELSRITAEQRALREERNAWMDSAEVQELEERRKAAIKEYGVLRLQQWKNATPEWQAYTAKRQEYNARAKALQDRADELTEALRGSRQVQEQADWEERQAQQAAYDRAVAESGLSVADYHRQSAASRFGTTDQFEAAGYILPDGQMLDFSGPEKTRRSQDHREIESVFGPAELGRNADSTTALNQFIAEGNVRVMAESPGVDISGEVRPSAAQLDAIRRMADTLGAARQGFNLDISDNTGKVVASKWYTGHVRGERVINDIRAFYETGSLPQDSGLSGFYSLRTSGGVNLDGARTLDEYIARKYGPQPAAQAAPAAAVPASDAAPAAVTPTTAEETTPTLERTAKSQSIQSRQESQFVRELGDLFGIPEGESRARLRQLATQLADQRRTTGSIDPALADSIFEEAYQQGRVIEEQFYNDHKALKDELRTTAVTLDAESRNSAEYRDLRRSAMGRVRLTNEGGVPVDVRYMELSQQYPGLFPESIINPLEQARKMVEVAASIRRSESSLESYLGEDAEIFRQDARLRFDEAVNELTDGVDKVRRLEEDTARQTAAKRPKKPKPMTTREVERLKNEAAKLSRKAERAMNFSALTEEDKNLVDDLLKGTTKLSSLDPNATPNFSEVKRVYEAKKAAQDALRPWREYQSQIKQNRIAEAQDMLEGTEEWQDKGGGDYFGGLRMAMETATRNIRDVSRKSGEAGKTAARKMTEAFQDVSTHEADKIKWENRCRKEIKALGLNQHESAYTQILGELQGLQAAEDMGYPRSLAEIEALRKAEADLLEKHGRTINRRKVERAIPVFQDFYKEVLDMENEANVQNGYDPIPARKGYFPHFKVNEPDGLLSAIAAKFGIVTKDDALPTDIAGITYQFKPGRRWNPFAQQRQGFETAYDALTGFDRYIDVAGDVIFHTKDISLLREIENGLRYKYGDEGLRQKMDKIRADETLTDEEKQEQLSQVKGLGKTHLSTFVQWLNEYTNLLAGKKSFHDRPMEADVGRSVYRTMNNLEGRVAANMVAFNPGSWLTNFIPIAQAVGQTSPRSLLQAGYDTVRSIVQDDGFAGQSVFLTNRRGSDPISLTPGQQFIRGLTSPMQWIDEFTSNVVTRAKFKDNMRAGMNQSEALADADRFAANLMADRSKGALPTIFARRNPVTKMFTMFQVEVNNQFRYLLKDLPDDLKEEGAMALAAALLKFFVASYLFNDLYEMVVGRRPAFDPIDMVNELIGDTTGYQLPNTFEEIGKAASGTASGEDFTTEHKGVAKAVAGLGGSIAEQTPFVGGVMGGGRLPLSSAVPDIGGAINSLARWVDGDLSKEKAFANVGDELEKPIYYLGFPVAGGQIKKMIEGASTIIGGGSYTLNSEGEKQLQFAVEDPTAGDWLTALTFGKWALPGGREYVENFRKKNVGYTQAYEAGYSTSILDQLYPGSGKGAGQVDYTTMLPEQENAAQVDSWLEKLFGQTGNKSVLPSNSTTGFTVDGEQVKLSGPEALEYARDRQTVGYEILSLFQAPESRPLDVQEQYAVYAQDYAAEVAKAEATGIPPAATGWVAKVQQLAGVSGTEVTDDLIDVLTARAIIANTKGRKQPNGKEIQGSRRRNVLEALRAEGYTTDEAIRLYEALT